MSGAAEMNTRNYPNAAAVMAAHANRQKTPWCIVCNRDGYASWPCLPYRLAEALAASEAKVQAALSCHYQVLEDCGGCRGEWMWPCPTAQALGVKK
jgi:hypothetical protein